MSISYFPTKVEWSIIGWRFTLHTCCDIVLLDGNIQGIVHFCNICPTNEYGIMELTTSRSLTDTANNTHCPVALTAKIISGKWTLLIIRDLASGVKRFNQLERSLHGISPKTLSERLRSLEEEGIIYRQTFAEVPPRVEYSLTEKGHDLIEVVECMRCYGKQWLCDANNS